MKHCLLLLSMLAMLPGIFAQEQESHEDPASPFWLVKGIHHGELMTDFIRQVESSLPVQFFYKSDWIDSVKVVQEDENALLTVILEHTLIPYGIGFRTVGHRIILFPEAMVCTPGSISFIANDTAGYTTTTIEFEEVEEVPLEGASTDRNQLIVIGNRGNGTEERVTLTGYIRDASTGEPIIGAVVYNEDQQVGVTTDVNGYYVINLNPGRHLITYRSVEKKEEQRNLQLNGDGVLNIEMEEKVTQLKGVVIVADKYQNVSGIQVGLNRIDAGMIRQVPSAMGEVDILKTALLLPGVQTVGEGASGFNVRGGSTDQNLVIINGAPVFNTSHLFGFFSAFNPDVIKEFKLFKSGITAEYGGRISSVFDITTRNGNRKALSGRGGISPITGRLVLEGPIVKEKASFIVGGRSTYSDWILKRINDPAISNSDASFYDLSGKLSWDVNKDNQVEVSAYYSKDYFRLNSDTTYDYSNANMAAGWKHIFNSKLIGRFDALAASYDYNISSDSKPDEAFLMKYQITQMEGKAGFSYFHSPEHKITFGLNLIYYGLRPGVYQPLNESSLVEPFSLEKEQALESAIYLADEFSITPELTVYGGLRYSIYSFLGPKTINQYYQGVPLDPVNIIDTVSHGRGAFIKTYSGPEWRINIRYRITPNSSVKISYNRLRQYLSMLSNTTAVSPTDTWKLSDPYIRPQIGDQVALGLYKDFRSQRIETSLELYYKNIRDMIEYKGGAQLLLNEYIEQDLINARGRAYGIELMIRRTAGKLNGWISYTYSRIEVKADSEFPVERINNGAWFPANHDKPHDLTFAGNFRFSRRFSMSSNLTYSTGRPITYPVARYTVRNMSLMHYTYRNEYRIPDYFRWDLAVNVEGNLKSRKLAHSSWSFSVYNVTGRDNVYSIYFVSQERDVQGYKLSIFTQPVFTVTYNFRF
jgi:hypothetical protein